MPDPESFPSALAGPGFFLDENDNVRVTVYNALAGVRTKVAGRRLDRHSGNVETFEHEFTPTSDRVASIMTRRLGGGWLLNLHVYASAGAPLIGQTFAIASIVRGQEGQVVDLATLAAGYVTSKQRVAWPGGLLSTSLDGAGALRGVLGTDPAAGVEISETVPTGARWELVSLYSVLTTDATVSNRRPTLAISIGGSTAVLAPSPANFTASDTWEVTFGQASSAALLAGTTISMIPLPVGLRLNGGDTIVTATVNLQAGDNWSPPRMVVREWIEGA